MFDPWKDRRVEKFSVVHEKLFHAFIISRDLQFFVHDHPTWENGAFHYDIAFPKPGMYRILGDFYPEAAAPQLITDTLFVAGGDTPAAQLSRDYSIKDAENLKVELSTNPPDPVAGVSTQLRLSVSPGDGLEKYLGAWGHMLAASDDLIDLTHTHPYIADGSAADAIQPGVPASARLPGLGAVPTSWHRQHRAFRRARQGGASAHGRLSAEPAADAMHGIRCTPRPLPTAVPTRAGCPRQSRTDTGS